MVDRPQHIFDLLDSNIHSQELQSLCQSSVPCGPEGSTSIYPFPTACGVYLDSDPGQTNKLLTINSEQTVGQSGHSTLVNGPNTIGTTFMNIPISGQVGILNSGNSFTSWMQNNLPFWGHAPSENCACWTHDAGMSTYTSGTAFAKPCNTLTQTLGILEQLSKGSRYFDIRPVISGGQYHAGHYTEIEIYGNTSWQGANGQSIQSIINDINTYTASNQELIILNLSHDLDTELGNSAYAPFTQAQWDALLTILEGINNRYRDPNPTTVDLTQLNLQHFIGNNQAAVIVVVDPSGSGISLGAFANQGFYSPGNLNVYNQYSDTNDLETMANDQLVKMKTQRTSQNSPCFLLSWTLTQSDGQAVACGLGVGSCTSILISPHGQSALCGKLWPACASQCYPNILYTDNANTVAFTALALAINFMAISGNPVPSGSPYAPPGATSTLRRTFHHTQRHLPERYGEGPVLTYLRASQLGRLRHPQY